MYQLSMSELRIELENFFQYVILESRRYCRYLSDCSWSGVDRSNNERIKAISRYLKRDYGNFGLGNFKLQ